MFVLNENTEKAMTQLSTIYEKVETEKVETEKVDVDHEVEVKTEMTNEKMANCQTSGERKR